MKLAIVRIRGVRNMAPKVKRTMEMLSLHHTNQCVVKEDTPSIQGMLQLCKDYVAFGPINEETLSALLHKRGEKGGRMLSEVMEKDEISEAAKKIMHGANVDDFADKVFRLHPPRKGFRDIKRPTSQGGDLGRREDMDSLVRKMM